MSFLSFSVFPSGKYLLRKALALQEKTPGATTTRHQGRQKKKSQPILQSKATNIFRRPKQHHGRRQFFCRLRCNYGQRFISCRPFIKFWATKKLSQPKLVRMGYDFFRRSPQQPLRATKKMLSPKVLIMGYDFFFRSP